eukprot:6692-Eustigmatos_ZCMA.PRE.1
MAAHTYVFPIHAAIHALVHMNPGVLHTCVYQEGNISIRRHGSPNAHRIKITQADGDAHSGRSWDE